MLPAHGRFQGTAEAFLCCLSCNRRHLKQSTTLQSFDTFFAHLLRCPQGVWVGRCNHTMLQPCVAW